MVNEFDVVVVGAGMVGAAIGYGLTRTNLRVLMLDGEDTDLRAAKANFGLVWAHGKGYGDPDYHRLSIEACTQWPAFAQQLEADSGISFAYEQNGGLYFCLSDAELSDRAARMKAWHEQTPELPVSTQILDRTELLRRFPSLRLGKDVAGVSFGEHDGQVNPLRLLAALQTAFQRRGGKLKNNAKVTSISMLPGGGYEVVTAGFKAYAPRVVLSAGLGAIANGHQAVMDSLLPHLRDGQTVIVSSMSSLSSLYLFEQAAKQGIRISVASFGTTVLTARRKSPTLVNVLTRRGSVSVSALPQSSLHSALELCESLFGGVFLAEDNPLVSTLANTNAVTHTPLALLNWTRIEREENWPQYHYMTASVSAIIEKIDAERLAIAEALGFKVRSVEEHFRQSFQIEQKNMAEIAAEMHKRRGGPPGPTDTSTRFLTEDVPFGLVFVLALAKIAGVPAPVTQANVTMASLVADKDFAADNAFIDALGLRGESVGRLLKRVSVA